MSDPQHEDAARSLTDRALDLLVFAPAGAVLTALEDLPAMAAKGRVRIDQELHNAHVIGRFAVEVGKRQVHSHLGSLFGGGQADTEDTDDDNPATPDPVAGTPAASGDTAPPTGPRGPAGAGSVARDPAVDLALPDYDSLSASQVVRRLDGLGIDELAAVERHELASRGRRTIVSRAQQLLAERGGTATES